MYKSKNKLITQLVFTAIFCTIIFLATAYLPRIPFGIGYVHIGDAFIYLAACILPTPLAMISAGVGAGFADVFTGYIMWLPATLIIKAFMAMMFSHKSEKILTIRNIFATLFAGIICISGYYLFEAILTQSFIIPISSIVYNVIQVLASAVIYICVAIAFDKAKIKARFS